MIFSRKNPGPFQARLVALHCLRDAIHNLEYDSLDLGYWISKYGWDESESRLAVVKQRFDEEKASIIERVDSRVEKYKLIQKEKQDKAT